MAILIWTEQFHKHISDEGHLSIKLYDFIAL